MYISLRIVQKLQRFSAAPFKIVQTHKSITLIPKFIKFMLYILELHLEKIPPSAQGAQRSGVQSLPREHFCEIKSNRCCHHWALREEIRKIISHSEVKWKAGDSQIKSRPTLNLYFSRESSSSLLHTHTLDSSDFNLHLQNTFPISVTSSDSFFPLR